MFNKKKYLRCLSSFVIFSIVFSNNVFVNAASKYERVGGKNRYETSSKIIDKCGTSHQVILVSGEQFPDALSASTLSKKYNAPIMLTNPYFLDNNLINKLSSMQVNKVFIVGGQGAVSNNIENSLNKINIETERLYGINRYETCISIAKRVDGVEEKIKELNKNIKENNEKLESNKKNEVENNEINNNQNNNIDKFKDISAQDDNDENNKKQENISKDKQDETIDNENKIDKQDNLIDTDKEKIKKQDEVENQEKIKDIDNTKENTNDEEDINIKEQNKEDENKEDENINKKQDKKVNVKAIAVVSGENFPDALAMSTFAGINDIPIILVGKNYISDSVKEYINTRNIEKTYVIGSKGVISENISSQFPNVERIGGKDRYETNELIIKRFNTNFNSLYIASGLNFADALSTTSLAIKNQSPIVLVSEGITKEYQDFIKQLINNSKSVYVIGGEGAVSKMSLYLVGLESKPAPKPKPIPKPSIIAPVIPKHYYVMNASETTRVYIKNAPQRFAKNIGYTYGALAEVKILKSVGNYYYVEALNYESGRYIKGYVLKSMVKSATVSTTFNILVDLNKQRVYVFKNGLKYKEFICSTGKPSTPTPPGRFLVGLKGPSFPASSNTICYFWTRLNNNYLFHSVIYDKYGYPLKSVYAKLGQKASAGCIRLKYHDAKWIQDNIPRNTLVTIK